MTNSGPRLRRSGALLAEPAALSQRAAAAGSLSRQRLALRWKEFGQTAAKAGEHVAAVQLFVLAQPPAAAVRAEDAGGAGLGIDYPDQRHANGKIFADLDGRWLVHPGDLRRGEGADDGVIPPLAPVRQQVEAAGGALDADGGCGHGPSFTAWRRSSVRWRRCAPGYRRRRRGRRSRASGPPRPTLARDSSPST